MNFLGRQLKGQLSGQLCDGSLLPTRTFLLPDFRALSHLPLTSVFIDHPPTTNVFWWSIKRGSLESILVNKKYGWAVNWKLREDKK